LSFVNDAAGSFICETLLASSNFQSDTATAIEASIADRATRWSTHASHRVVAAYFVCTPVKLTLEINSSTGRLNLLRNVDLSLNQNR
jgi:hypothetical protein